MKQELLELLAKSLDEQLTAGEVTQLEEALADYAWLREERVKLLQMRELLGQWTVSVNPGFTDGVMKAIETEKEMTSSSLFVRLFPKVAVACLIFLAVELTVIYITEGSLSTDAIIGLEDLSVEDDFTFVE